MNKFYRMNIPRQDYFLSFYLLQWVSNDFIMYEEINSGLSLTLGAEAG